jgi:AcrR family transcriptional regulator
MRPVLIEAAARLIATQGADALTLRRVADEVGTSTMAIYTHFGGMPELRRAVRREGFARLAALAAQIGESEDPVADLAMLGLAYAKRAASDPHLYRVMYMEQPLDEADAAAGSETFEILVSTVQRCIASGRFDAADARDLATQFWAVGHGAITLQMAQLLSLEEADRCLAGAVLNLFIAFGDDRDAARRSFKQAARRAARIDPGPEHAGRGTKQAPDDEAAPASPAAPVP